MKTMTTGFLLLTLTVVTLCQASSTGSKPVSAGSKPVTAGSTHLGAFKQLGFDFNNDAGSGDARCQRHKTFFP
jgi:hypothetical protein